MKRRDFVLCGVGAIGLGLLGLPVEACPCKGIERLTTDNKSSYSFKAGGKNVTIPLLKMTDKEAVDFANAMCLENRTCKVFIVKSNKGDFYGVFTVEGGP